MEGIQQVNFGISVFDNKSEDNPELVYVCGFEDKPTDDDFKELASELSSDDGFILKDKVDSLVFDESTPELVELINESKLFFEDPEFNFPEDQW